jgi:hypothetical protein
MTNDATNRAALPALGEEDLRELNNAYLTWAEG